MTETRPRERVESIGGAVHERLAVQVERRVQNGADPGATLELPNDPVVLGIPRLVHEMSARGAVLRMDGRHNLVKIGRASCRERVECSVGTGGLNKKVK